MILYGISTCDTCKRALKTLQAAGKDVTFRDIRAQPLTDGRDRGASSTNSATAR